MRRQKKEKSRGAHQHDRRSEKVVVRSRGLREREIPDRAATLLKSVAVRGFRRGNNANNGNLSAWTVNGNNSPSNANANIGFGKECAREPLKPYYVAVFGDPE